MITMESGAMRAFLQNRRWIIGAALAGVLLLAGCSMARIGYSQAPMLTHWWADGYISLNAEQSRRFKESLDVWFDWHRRTQLPDYANLLAKAQREVMGPLTREAMCTWRDELQRRVDPVVEHTAPGLASLALTLTPEQLQHLEKRLAKNGAEMKRDYAQDDREERRKRSLQRTIERYEQMYGRFDDAQRERVAQLLQNSPFDADRWMAERERRSRDTVAALASVVAAAKAQDPAAAQQVSVQTVKLIARRSLRSPRADYAAYQERLSNENCALAAEVHNMTTPQQRQHARGKLRGWEGDVRALMAMDSPKASQGLIDAALMR
jgi:Family of unknown function (DUF6279)